MVKAVISTNKCENLLAKYLKISKLSILNKFKKLSLSRIHKISISLKNIYNKRDGTMFENNVTNIFKRNKKFKVNQMGADINGTQGDGGIDILICNQRTNRKIIVQCKNVSRNVGPREIREFAGILKEARHSKVEAGYYVTSAFFTKGAIHYTEQFNKENNGKIIKLFDSEWYSNEFNS